MPDRLSRSEMSPVVLLSVICSHCTAHHMQAEFEVGDSRAVPARELADGSVCIQCPLCERDLAVVR